jgi:hypothetical protein
MFCLSSGVKAFLVYVAVIVLSMLLMGRICLDKIQIAELKAQQAELFVKFLQQTADMLTLKTELEITIQARINVQKQLEELIAANSSTSTLAIVGTVFVSVVAIGAICLLVSHGILLANQHALSIASMADGFEKGLIQHRPYTLSEEQVFQTLVHKTRFLIAKEEKLIAAIERLDFSNKFAANSIVDFINLTQPFTST